MMYRCNVCRAVSGAGRPLLRHLILKPDGDILREIPVCLSCHEALADGEPLSSVSRRKRPQEFKEVQLTPQAPTPRKVSLHKPPTQGA